MLDWERFEALTFDCYGTLVDWEAGILGALRPVLAAHKVALDDETILERYARLEAEEEAGAYLPYREVLRNVGRRLCESVGFTPTPAEADCLPASFGNWRPFPDTVAALRILKRRYQLVIVSNVDDDLFALTAPQLEVTFDAVITAAQVKSYKPSPRNFEVALQRIGLPRERVLHVAQSLFHDVVPAKSLGLAAVWVNRRKDKAGSGATVPAVAQPDLEVPDLRTLAELVGR